MPHPLHDRCQSVLDIADALDLLHQALSEARATLLRRGGEAGPGARDLAFDAAVTAEAAALRAVADSDALVREMRGWHLRVRLWCDEQRPGPADHPARRAALEDLKQSLSRVPASVYRAVLDRARGRPDAVDAGREAIAWLETALDAEQVLLAAAPHDTALVRLVDVTEDLRRAVDARCAPSHG